MAKQTKTVAAGGETVKALDYLASPEKYVPRPVCVLFGDEHFLRREALSHVLSAIGSGDDSPPSVFGEDDQQETRWQDVASDIATVSLFGGAGAKRVAVVRDADSFVSKYRSQIEEYCENPRTTSALILLVGTWAANTRLYKLVDQTGLQIDCRVPEIARGKGKSVDEAAIQKWLHARAESFHGVKLKPGAATLLFQLVGPSLGMLDQDLAKIALLAKKGEAVTPEQVQEWIGGWRAKTAWDMIDAACDGNAAEALLQLDRLLHAGEEPIAIFGQLSWSLRRYPAALRAYERSLRAGRKIPLREALLAGGFFQWPQGALDAAEARTKQLGRERLAAMNRWLHEMDLSLKGSHSSPSRARFALEKLFLKMAKRPETARG